MHLVEDHCYLIQDYGKYFIEANVLNAVDGKILKLDFDKLKFNAETIEGEKPQDKHFRYWVTQDDKELASAMVPYYAASKEDHARMLMGGTMMILQGLKDHEKKGNLRIVK